MTDQEKTKEDQTQVSEDQTAGDSRVTTNNPQQEGHGQTQNEPGAGETIKKG